ncbi:MAG: lytic transglycosylase domain-containing protein [Ghiorsea sp.]
MRFPILLFLFFLVSTPAHGEIYKYLDASGKLYITDKKLKSPYHLLPAFKPWSAFKVRTTSQSSKKSTYNPEVYNNHVKEYLPHIRQTAKKHALDPRLIHAIIDTESAFNPKAYSKAGAVGLMQLMPKTAQRLGVQDSWNPRQNIQGGTLLMRKLLDRFDQNIKLSLAAYNAGETAVIKAGYRIPNYPETKRYVKKVMKRYHELSQAI